ncbi:hypothetical protein PR202_gb08346 [Eleusine coracana subsp. coracana]|uniref:Uncharacterized protein n=1 Tax=Eleusine coracana subsp. coracana TaxID=191504 RepID=A0AAV5EFH7_ELECO|nr:hypothetical protein PR202_gb08346 [Eleusine coracana subsp. coracana]
MTVNGFRRGEGGGGPAACDEHFHGDDEMIAALSTRWYANGQRATRRSSSPACATAGPWRPSSWTNATRATGARTTSWTRQRPCGRRLASTPTSVRCPSLGPTPDEHVSPHRPVRGEASWKLVC